MEVGKVGVWANIDGPLAFFENDQSASLGFATAERIARFAQRVEELGYSALWMPEAFGRNLLITASWLLANTSKLNVASGIASIYARDAMATAAAMNALNEQSNGRFILGLGVSHRMAVEGIRGHEYLKPVPAMRGYLEAISKAPYYAAPPPEEPVIVLAALRDKMLALSSARAHGAHTYAVTPDHTARARAILGPDKLLCVEQKLVLESDPAAARAIARSELELYLTLENYLNAWRELGFSDADFAGGGSDRLIDSIVGWGDEAALRRRVQEHLDAGATQVCVKPLGPDGSTDVRIVELLAPAKS